MEILLALLAAVVGVVVFIIAAIGIAIISVADGIKGFMTKKR